MIHPLSRIALFLAATCLPIQAAPPPPLTVAVLDFQGAGEKFSKAGTEAGLLLSMELSKVPEILLVEREEVDKVLGEQALGLSGAVTPDSAARTGALIGAQVLITGRLFEAGGKTFLVAKIMGTETSRVFGEAVSFADLGALDKAVAELEPKIQADLVAQAGVLTAKAETPAARLERLRKLLPAQKRPTVSIEIPERHLARPIPDPAVETELKATLQQLGFEIVERQASAPPAEVAITGEAFSEAAGRHAGLFSCRARIELKAVRTSDGRLLFTDRQAGMAVDLAENIAAKAALENGARAIVERLAPKLVQP